MRSSSHLKQLFCPVSIQIFYFFIQFYVNTRSFIYGYGNTLEMVGNMEVPREVWLSKCLYSMPMFCVLNCTWVQNGFNRGFSLWLVLGCFCIPSPNLQTQKLHTIWEISWRQINLTKQKGACNYKSREVFEICEALDGIEDGFHSFQFQYRSAETQRARMGSW